MKDILLMVLFCCFFVSIKAQTVIFTNPGASYTNIDNSQPTFPVEDNYGGIDISNCTSVRFSMDFSFSLPWFPAPGDRMETPEACPSGGGCSGLVQDALVGGCNNCWDFMNIEILLDGVSVFTELIGEVGETRQTGNVEWTGCTNGASTMTIIITNMNWSASETNTFSNLQVECWDASPTADYNPIPACEGQPINLTGSIATPADAISHSWTGTGGTITDPNALNTTVTGATNGDTYTLTTTDINNCTASSSVVVDVIMADDATFSIDDFCVPTSSAPYDIATPGGIFSFDPTPGDGATIDPVTGVISNATGGSTYSVKYTTTGTCPGEETITVDAIEGPVGVLSGGGILCPGDCTTFSFSFTSGSEPYTIQLTVNPPGFALPSIPGVTASSNFTICYQGGGLFPTFDQSTLTVTIPTTYTGSGSLVLTGISDNSGCPGSASGSYNLTLEDAPDANPAGPLMACPDANGNGTFDLTTLNNTINGGSGNTVSWFTDSGGNNPINDPTNFTTSGTTVYAQVSDGTCTSDLIPVELIIENDMVPFIDMYCDQPGTYDCPQCIASGLLTDDIWFQFGDNEDYIVTIRDESTGQNIIATVNNSTPITQSVSSTTGFTLISIQPVSGCSNTQTFNNVVTLTYNEQPDIDPIVIPPGCDPVTLPPITGTNLTGNELYYTGPLGTGTSYAPGAVIEDEITLYIFSDNAGCIDEEVVNIVMPKVWLNPIDDLTDCESVLLPPITGQNTYNPVYNTDPDGNGTQYLPGDVITSSTVLYLLDAGALPGCLQNSEDVSIIITGLPQAPTYSSVNCTGGNGNGSVSITNPLGSNYEYSLDGGPFTFDTDFSMLNNGTHTVTVKDGNTGCINTSQFTVNCDCPDPAIIFLPSFTGDVCVGDTFRLDSITTTLNVNEVRLSSNGNGTLTPIVSNTSPFGFTYIPSISDTSKAVVVTLTSNDPDGNGPCSPDENHFTIHVHGLPKVNITGDQTICKDSMAVLVASGGIKYQWSDGGGSLATATYTNLISDTTFYVTVTNEFGCKDTGSFTVKVAHIYSGRDSMAVFCKEVATSVDLNSYLSSDADTTGIWKIGTDTIKNPENYVVTDLPLGQTTILYIINSPICGKDTAIITVDIRDGNFAGNDVQFQYCMGSDGLINLNTLLSSHDSGGDWTVSPPGSLNLQDPTQVDISGLNTGNYDFIYIIPANKCSADTAHVVIEIIARPDAGKNVEAAVCLGSQIDLINIVQTQDLSGSVLNPNNYPGFTGSIWNTSGIAEGKYEFIYVLAENAACQGDTALISVSVQAALNAGQDVNDSFCEQKTISLWDYIDTNADQGGTFYFNNQPLANGILIPQHGVNSYTIIYEVGDGVLCPKTSATINLTQIAKPEISMSAPEDLCSGRCQDIVINHDAPIGSVLFLSAVDAVSGEQFEQTLTVNTIGQFTVQICAGSQPPFGFDNLRENRQYTIQLEKVELPSLCSYIMDIPISFKTLPLATKTIHPVVCAGSSFEFEGVVFDASNPNGTVTVQAADNTSCDTIVTVDLSFYPEARSTYEVTLCSESQTISVGDEEFSFSRPEGDVVLKGASAHGCDSIVHVKITFDKKVVEGDLNITSCDENYQIVIGGVLFNSAHTNGQVLLPGAAVGGCDSLVNVQLNIIKMVVDYSLVYNCHDEPATFTMSSASYPGPYTIKVDEKEVTIGANLPYVINFMPGPHTVEVINPDGCHEYIILEVDENSTGPNVTLTQTPLGDGSVQIMTLAPPISIHELQWTPSTTLSCESCFDPIANPAVTTTYTLSYLYGVNCKDSRQITIERVGTDISLPNIFSPNGDGNNESFYVILPDKVTGIVRSMRIFDRWGNLVFNAENVPANDPEQGWKGTFHGRDAAPGVYVYVVEVFTDNKGTVDIYSGSLTLVR